MKSIYFIIFLYCLSTNSFAEKDYRVFFKKLPIGEDTNGLDQNEFLKAFYNESASLQPGSVEDMLKAADSYEVKKSIKSQFFIRFIDRGILRYNKDKGAIFQTQHHTLTINDFYLKHHLEKWGFSNKKDKVEVEIDGFLRDYNRTSSLTLTYINQIKVLKRLSDKKNIQYKLFDGQTFNGWQKPVLKGDHIYNGSHWYVDQEENALVGRRLIDDKRGGWLWTHQKYDNFILSFEVKPDWGCDTGVLLRQNDQGGGLQITIDYRDGGNIGFLHGQGIGSFYTRPFSLNGKVDHSGNVIQLTAEQHYDATQKDGLIYSITPDEFLKIWKPNDYNQFKIKCTGRHANVTIWINDTKVCEMDSSLFKAKHPLKDDIKTYDSSLVHDLTGGSGRIGFQVHPGKNWALPDGLVKYRNVSIAKLN